MRYQLFYASFPVVIVVETGVEGELLVHFRVKFKIGTDPPRFSYPASLLCIMPRGYVVLPTGVAHGAILKEDVILFIDG